MIEIAAGIGIANGALALIKEVSGAFEKKKPHEVREALSEIRGKVLDLQSALQDAHEREAKFREEIANLKKKAEDEWSFEDHNGLLFKLNDERKRQGEPYCHHCYVDHGKLFRAERVKLASGHDYRCRNCENALGDKGPARMPKFQRRKGIV